MTSKRQRLPVVYAAAARQELDQIWDWIEKTYGRQHATDYVQFLIRQIDGLAARPERGRVPSGGPILRYLPFRLKQRGHGHVMVYMSWQTRYMSCTCSILLRIGTLGHRARARCSPTRRTAPMPP